MAIKEYKNRYVRQERPGVRGGQPQRYHLKTSPAGDDAGQGGVVVSPAGDRPRVAGVHAAHAKESPRQPAVTSPPEAPRQDAPWPEASRRDKLKRKLRDAQHKLPLLQRLLSQSPEGIPRYVSSPFGSKDGQGRYRLIRNISRFLTSLLRADMAGQRRARELTGNVLFISGRSLLFFLWFSGVCAGVYWVAWPLVRRDPLMLAVAIVIFLTYAVQVVRYIYGVPALVVGSKGLLAYQKERYFIPWESLGYVDGLGYLSKRLGVTLTIRNKAPVWVEGSDGFVESVTVDKVSVILPSHSKALHDELKKLLDASLSRKVLQTERGELLTQCLRHLFPLVGARSPEMRKLEPN